MNNRNQPLNNEVVSLNELTGDERNNALAEFDPGGVGDDAMPDDIALMNLLGQIEDDADDVKVFTYKVDPKTRRKEYLDQFTVLQFSTSGFDDLRNGYGAGEFQIRVMRGRELLANRIVKIAESLQKKNAPPAIDIAAVMRENNAVMMAGFEKIALSLHAPQTAGITFQDILAALPVLLPVLRGSGNGEQNPFDIMRQTMELMREARVAGGGGEGGEGDVMLRALEIFGKPLAEMVTKARAAPAALALNAPVEAGNATTPFVQADPVSPQEQEMNLMAMAYKKMIVAAASRNDDPVTYAELVLNNFSDAQINDFFVKESWFEEVKAFIPEAAQYPAWFGELRRIALELLQEEQKPDSVPALNPASTGNVPQ